MTFALIVASALQGQVHYAEYADAARAAEASGTPLVVWHDVRPQMTFDNYLSVSAKNLEGYAGFRGILVSKSVPGHGLCFYGKLPATATVADIEAVLAKGPERVAKKEVQPEVAIPFQEEPASQNTFGKTKWYHKLSGLARVDDNSLRGIGLVPYESTRVTQESGNRSGGGASYIRSRFDPRIPSKWHQPGGLEGVTGWTSKLYIYEEGVQDWYGRDYNNDALIHRRRYGPGSVTVDILSTDKGIFSARAREKTGEDIDDWVSYEFVRNVKSEPKGYVRPKSCMECHQAGDGPGFGGYGGPIVPGDDTVFSRALPLQARSGNAAISRAAGFR